MKPKTSLVVVALICLQAITARAATFTLNLDRVLPTFVTRAPSSSIQPWLTATFTDLLGPNGNNVVLTMTALNLSTNTVTNAAGTVSRPESVAAWWFNINPALSSRIPGGVGAGPRLNIAYVNDGTASDVQAQSVVQSGVGDTEQAPTDGWYDFRFTFAPAGVSSAFTNGSKSVYDLTGVNQVIHASDFVGFFSSPTNNAGLGKSPNGIFESAANITDTVNQKNGAFDNAVIGAVPEPATWLLCMVAVPVLIRFSRRPKP